MGSTYFDVYNVQTISYHICFFTRDIGCEMYIYTTLVYSQKQIILDKKTKFKFLLKLKTINLKGYLFHSIWMISLTDF